MLPSIKHTTAQYSITFESSSAGQDVLHFYGTLIFINIFTKGWLLPRTRFRFEQLREACLFRKFPAFYGNQTVITGCKASSPAPILSQMNPVSILLFYFPNILFNIILPYMQKYFKWSPLSRLFDQDFMHISQLPVWATGLARYIHLVWSPY